MCSIDCNTMNGDDDNNDDGGVCDCDGCCVFVAYVPCFFPSGLHQSFHVLSIF